MIRFLFRAAVVAIVVALGGCDTGADAGTPGAMIPSAVIRQVTPVRGHFDDIVVAYGQGAAGSGGTRALTLPIDATLTRVDVAAGQHVNAGQVLASFVPTKAAAAARVAARSAVALARAQRERTARLLADHLATNDQLAQADKAMHDAEAAFAAQDTPHEKLQAPADGTVLTIDTLRGAQVAAGGTIMTLADTDCTGFAGGIEPADRARVHAGDTVALHALSGGRELPARVATVAGAVDPQSRLVGVTVSTSYPLIQGMAYRADIVVGSLAGWQLPADAVTGEEGARAVWQVRQGQAHRVPVTVVAQHGDQVLVAGAIEASLALVTVGATQLDEGIQVRPMDTP
ncbi:efflux RND transporter periplasmic adaptor subunit [Xanthomonas sp. NCPPB 2632]|uniref:efflux RND transporter periplasmic adaptor subunit n=1 Tax=Xanthomonas sp. NCPPB 2632 TaxID=3240912 RepID=UPI0035180A84